MAARVGPVGLFTLEVPRTDMGLEGLRKLPKFQPRRSTALGLLEQTAVNSQPTVRNGDADLTTYLYDPATVPPVMNINTLRPKIALEKNAPMQLRASLAQGLTSLAQLDQATNAIGAITAANNALAIGNVDRAEAILGRKLTSQEVTNRNVTPILRRDEHNPAQAIDIANQNPNPTAVAVTQVYGASAPEAKEREEKSSGQTRRNYDTGAMAAHSGNASAASHGNAATRDPTVNAARPESKSNGDDIARGPTQEAILNPSINIERKDDMEDSGSDGDAEEVKEYTDGAYTMPIQKQFQASQNRAGPVSGLNGVSWTGPVMDAYRWWRGVSNEEKELGRTGNSMSVPRSAVDGRKHQQRQQQQSSAIGFVNENEDEPGMLWTEQKDRDRMRPLTQATGVDHINHVQDMEGRYGAEAPPSYEGLFGGGLKKNYVPLGKFLVHKEKLSGGQLSMCYPNGKKLHDFPNTLLTKNMHHHVRAMVDRTVPAKHIKLKPDESHFVSRLKRRVFGPPPSAGSLHTRVPLKEQLMIALGEINAGNDSPKIKMKIKRMLPQLKYVVSPEFISQIKQKFL